MSVPEPEEVVSEDEWPDDMPTSYEAWCIAARILARDEVGRSDREPLGPKAVWPVGPRGSGMPIAVIADEILKEVEG